MAKTAEESMRRYAQGVQNGAAVWNARKPSMSANWAQSVQAGPIRSANYQRGISNAQYRAGDPAKW